MNKKLAILALIVPLWFLCPQAVLALVNINTASVAELQTLTGIGESKAAAIIDYRTQNGEFSTKSDIINVSGIGDVTYENIKDAITVDSSQSTGSESTTDNSEKTTGNSSNTTTRSSDQDKRVPIDGLVLTAPEYAFVGQQVHFSALPDDHEPDRLVRYRWNFGDATVASGRDVTHTYNHVGTYIVIVESYYLKEPKTARRQIKILEPKLSLSRGNNGELTLTNDSKYEIDLSGMQLSGGGEFIFPKYSVLLPGGSVSFNAAELPEVGTGSVTLYDQSGTMVASNYVSAVNTAPTAVARVSSVSRKTPQLVVEQTPEIISTMVDTASTSQVNVAAVSDSVGDSEGESRLPYLGLLAVISVGMLAVYSYRW